MVSQEAYRIVQEGLTNALKYSADGTVMLGLSLGSDTLDIQLTNPARDRQPAAGGRGLRGINERAAALKGATTAGAHDGLLDAFRVPPRAGRSPVTAIQVLLVDDEPLVRSGLRAILESEPDLTVVGEADDGAAAISQARRTRPDIVLMDVRMPRVDGIAATRQLAQFDDGGPAVIVVTTFDNDDYVYDALQAGARGFLLKRSAADDFVNAIRTVHDGESLLYPTAIRELVTHHGRQDAAGLAKANLTQREERGPAAGRPGPVQPGNRGRTVPRRRDCEDPRPQRPGETRRQEPRPGCHHRLREWLHPLTPPSRLPIR